MDQPIEDVVHAKTTLETALLTSPDPLPVAELCKLFDGAIGPDLVRRMLDDLRQEYANKGVELVCVASGWRFQSRAEYQRALDRLNPQKPPRYSRAVLETLAIIAYRQPVSRPEVDAVRGVNSEGVLDNLLERRLVRIAGRKDTPGRPFLYETTRDFLVAFGLRDLADLPKPEGELVIPDVSAPDAPAQGELDKELAAATDPSQQDPGPGGAELAPRG